MRTAFSWYAIKFEGVCTNCECMLKFKISYWDLLEIFKFFSELLWFYSPNFLFLLLLFADDLVWLFGNQI